MFNRIPDEREFQNARVRISRFALECALSLARQIGFSYEESADAPQTYEAVQQEYAECMRKRRAFRVWNGASDDTIYTSHEANWSFRFWHDCVSHGAHKLTFTLADELTAAREWVEKVEGRFGVDSLEARLAYLDTAGESLYQAERGEFPVNQLAFVRGELGMTSAQ